MDDRRAPGLAGLDRSWAATAVFGIALWIGVALWQGYDFQWDVLNYHFYNGFAFLHGRVFANVQPAMWQNYFPPVMDAVFYLMVRWLPPTIVLLAIATFQSVVFPLLFQLGRVVLWRPAAGRGAVALVGCLTLLGAAAPVNIYEAGGALGDTSTAVLVLAALLVLVASMARQGPVASPCAALLAGGLAGLSAGLKLTNLVFVPALLAVMLVALPVGGTAPEWRRWARAMAACVGGIAGAFLVSDGWWAALLWVRLGNPVFPEFNQWFGSRFAMPVAYKDPTFAVPGLWAKLAFAFTRTSISGRLDPAGLFDVRMAITLPICVLGVLAACIGRRQADIATRRHHCARLALPVFVLVGYICWLNAAAVNRYLVAVDMVAPLACVVSLGFCLSARAAAWGLVAALSVALPASAYTSWSLWWLPGGHRHGDEGGYFGVRFTPPAGLHGGVVAMLGGWPSTFVIAFFPRDTVFARLQGSLLYLNPAFGHLNPFSPPAQRRAAFGNAMGAAICERLDHAKGGLFLLRPAPETVQDIQAMIYFGLEQAPGPCTQIESKSDLHIDLCPARRLARPECTE